MSRLLRLSLQTMLTVVLAVASAFVLPATAEGRWLGPDAKPLPFDNDAAMMSFLREAEVVDRTEIPQGINRPLKIRLRRGEIEAHAVFRTVNVRKMRHENRGRTLVNFHDGFIYECAAYHLSRLLGLDNVPPCVKRTLDGREGSVQLWVESAMTEKDRRDQELEAPSPARWARQNQTMRAFDGLIYNFDRNQGNILVDTDWKIWFIDHTRSFRIEEEVPALERIIWCDRALWEGLHRLNRDLLKEHLGDFLSKKQIKAILVRRGLLVEHLQGRIAEVGEGAVLFSWGDPGDPSIVVDDIELAGSGDDIPKNSTVEGDG